MRYLGLFLIGPALGIGLVSCIFGLSPQLRMLAALMSGFSFALLGGLVAGERKRLLAEFKIALRQRPDDRKPSSA